MLNDIPENFNLNDRKWMQVKCEVNNETQIDQDSIRNIINELNYPIHHLDFVTFATTVAIFDGSRPYQHLVFQYLLHIEHSDRTIEHKEYLAEANGEDPRIKFIEQLTADSYASGDILVYNIDIERGKLNDLIEFSPEYTKAIQQIVDRLKDFMILFR